MYIDHTERLLSRPVPVIVQFAPCQKQLETSGKTSRVAPGSGLVVIFALSNTGAERQPRGSAMGGELQLDQSVNITQSDGDPPKGAVEFGVDLSNPRLIAQAPSDGEHTFQVRQDTQSNSVAVKNEGPIAEMSLPTGWTEATPGAGKPGLWVKNGSFFVPPDHESNPSVRIRVGPAMERVAPDAESALRQLFQSKPAINGPQELTPQEKFDVESASTVNINGKTALLVKGKFSEGAQAGLERETLYIDNKQASRARFSPDIEELYLAAPPDKFQQYNKAFWDSAHSIRWV
jgi:hypothetical protein